MLDGLLFAVQALPFLQVPDVVLYVTVAPELPILEVGAVNGAVIQLHEGKLIDLQCPAVYREVLTDPPDHVHMGADKLFYGRCHPALRAAAVVEPCLGVDDVLHFDRPVTAGQYPLQSVQLSS